MSATGHFARQRLTALLNLPLSLFMLWALAAHSDYASAQAFFSQIPAAILALVFLLNTLWHMRLGLQGVIDDYLAGSMRSLAGFANSLLTASAAIIAAASLARLALSWL